MLNHPNDQVGTEVLAFLSVFMHDGNAHVQVKHDSPLHTYSLHNSWYYTCGFRGITSS